MNNAGVRNRLTTAGWTIIALLALNAVLVVAQPGVALPRSLADYFFGPAMIRAEVAIQDGTVTHDYRLDQGRLLTVAPARGTLRLRERDGRVVTVQVSPSARIELHGQPVPLAALRRGVRVLVVRDGEQPAETVLAGRR